MSSVKRAIILNGLAGTGAKILLVLVRIVQVPLLLSVLGTEEYGRWIVLTSLPSLINLTNLGFGSITTNEMSIAIGEQQFLRAKKMFSTCLAFTTLISLLGILISVLVVHNIKWYKLIDTSINRQSELTQTVLFLLVALFISFSGEVFGGRMIATRKTHKYFLIYSLKPWIDLIGLYTICQFTIKFNFLAGALLCSTIVYIILLKWLSSFSVLDIRFAFKHVDVSYFKEFFKKGVAFQAIPLGNAILNQGNLFIVQTNLGVTAVAMYSTVRTLIRSINQLLDLINSSTWAEISLLIGQGDLVKLARLHRLAIGCAILLSSFGVFFLSIFGNRLYEIWVGKLLPIPNSLLLLFLLPLPFYSIWYTSSVIHMASNKHEKLAVNYIIACCASAIGCYILTRTNGLDGAAVATVIADLLLLPFVIRRSLQIVDDTWLNFLKGIVQELKVTYVYSTKVLVMLKSKTLMNKM